MDFTDYFQLIFLILFYVLFLGRTLFLFTKGIKVFVLGKGKKGLDRLLEISFLIMLSFWTIVLIVNALNIPFRLLPPILSDELLDYFVLDITGIILNCAGIIIFTAALLSFGKSWRVGIDKDRPDKLITRGIFSITRNPIFLFLDLYFIGTWCIYTNLFFLICTLFVIGGTHYQIRKEEAFLLSHYGKEYEEYTKKVRRYI